MRGCATSASSAIRSPRPTSRARSASGPGSLDPASAFLAQWSELPPGWHRFMFGDGRVLLTLLVGDVGAVLPRLDAAHRCVVPGWFRAGEEPGDVANGRACPGRTAVRSRRYLRDLHRRRRGPARARGRRLRGREDDRVRPQAGDAARSPAHADPCGVACPVVCPPVPRAAEREAIVIGAGLAGASTAASLAARGWSVTLLDRHDASQPKPPAIRRVRSTRACRRTAPRSASSSPPVCSTPAGACRARPRARRGFRSVRRAAARSTTIRAPRQSRLAAQGWPTALLLARLDRAEASARAGIAVPSGGLLFPRAGWVVRPRSCRALVDPSLAIRVALRPRSAATVDESSRWLGSRMTAPGRSRRAPVVVIAALGLRRLHEIAHLPLRLIRGQLTLRPGDTGEPRSADGSLRRRLRGAGGRRRAQPRRDPQVPRPLDRVTAAEHAENLAKLAALAPALYASLGGDRLRPGAACGPGSAALLERPTICRSSARSSMRAFRRRLCAAARDATLEIDTPSPWLEGLYVNTAHGSRGLVTAPLSGEHARGLSGRRASAAAAPR